MTFAVKASINGSAVQTVPLAFWDDVAGQKRYRAVASLPDGSRPLLFDLDVWDGFYSLRVLNAFDTEKAGPCSLWCEIEGQEPINVPDFRYLCGFRRTWGTPPPCVETQTMFGLERAEVDWPVESIPPLGYGSLLKIGYLATGGRSMLSVDHVNWVHDKPTRRRYSDAAIHLPVHALDFAEPFAPVARPGFAMGFNRFSARGMPNTNVSALGMKVNFSHASSLTMWDALVCPSRYAIDETVAWGSAAVMQDVWMQGEVRKQARALTAAIHGWCWSGSAFLEASIKAQLQFYETRAGDLFNIPYGRVQDNGRWIVAIWQYALLAYAIDYAIRVRLIERSEYLENLLAFFAAIAPLLPYALYLSGDVRPEDDLDYIWTNNNGLREADAWVVGWLLEKHGGESPWKFETLMDDDENAYPPSHNIAYHLTEPEARPVPAAGVTYTRFRKPGLVVPGHREEATAFSPVLSVAKLVAEPEPPPVPTPGATIPERMRVMAAELTSMAAQMEVQP